MSAHADIIAVDAEAFRTADRRPIDEWAADNIVMGSWSPWPGKFSATMTPWIVEPLRVLGCPGPRRVTIVAPAAGGKSTIGEIFVAWAVCNAPGLTSWFAHTEEKAKEFAETRLHKMLSASPAVARWLDGLNRSQLRTQAIHFPHMSFLVQAANETNAQSKHIRHLLLDETWQYQPGMMAQLHKRTTRFKHNRTIIEISTGSLDGDETDEALQQSTRQEWQLFCPECQQHHVPLWSFGKDKRGGVKWDAAAKRADGTWDKRRVAASTVYECPHCGAQFAANDANAYALNGRGRYTDPAADAMANHWGFHWNCIASDFAQLGAWACEYLDAKAAAKLGAMVLLQEFTQKRLALAWKEVVTDADITKVVETDYKMGEPWADEFVRFMTVDVQQTHFWVVVRAWSKAQTSRLVWAGRVESWGEVRETQLRYRVENTRTLVDSGHFTDAAYTECACHGWYAIKGEPSKRGYMQPVGNGRFKSEICEFSGGNGTRTKFYPTAPRRGGAATFCHLIKVSDPQTSGILGFLRAGTAGWTGASDAPKDWRDQLSAVRWSEKKKTWETVAKCGEHLWDCERYQLAAAVMSGVLKLSLQPNTTKEENANDTDSKATA